MEAKDFVYDLKRLCKYYGGVCDSDTKGKCPLNNYNCLTIKNMEDEVFDIVEQWAKEHPAKTRQSEFMKQFPHAKMWEDGDFIDICPKHLNELYLCGEKRGQTCYECCKDYWGAVVE